VAHRLPAHVPARALTVAHYLGTHVPLVAKTLRLVENRVHRVTRRFVGEPGYHLLAELVFASPEAMKAGMRSPEWAASGEDLASWGGMELVTMFAAEPVATEAE
jgi:uncharacterized protein (TIGR02118 family)